MTDLQPPANAEALIFDWDGTLADTTTANFLSLRDGLGRHGALLERYWFDRRTGLSTGAMVAELAATHNVSLDPNDVTQRRNVAFLERFMHVVEPVAPVLAVAQAALFEGRQLAIATGGTKVSFEPTLDRFGIREMFAVIVTREDVDHGKPAPDLFNLALTRLKVSPRSAVVYEDSDEGIEAAAAAGIQVIDVRPIVAPGRLP